MARCSRHHSRIDSPSKERTTIADARFRVVAPSPSAEGLAVGDASSVEAAPEPLRTIVR
jgi:hypothetical protein